MAGSSNDPATSKALALPGAYASEHAPTLVAVESQAVAHRTGNRTGRLVVEIVPQIVP